MIDADSQRLIDEMGALAERVLAVETTFIANQDWSLIQKQVASVYSGLCLMAWNVQEQEAKGNPDFSGSFAAKLEDLVLLYAARLKREPPEWIIRCSHD